MPAQGLEIGVGGVDEEHECQSEVSNHPQLDGVDVEIEKTQSDRPRNQTEGNEQHGPGNHTPFQAARDHTESKGKQGERS